MKYTHFFRWSIPALLVLTVIACNRWDNAVIDVVLEPDVAFPVFNTTVTVQDIFANLNEDTELQIDEDSGLKLVYTSEGYSVDLQELLTVIPDIEFPMPDTIFEFPYELPNNISIDYVLVKNGWVKYAITAPTFGLETIETTLSIPELSLNNEPFERTFQFNVFSGFIDSFSVADYILEPENDTLTIEYRAHKVSDGTPFDLNGILNLEFKQLQGSYMQGYLGTGTYDTPRDTVEIDFFQNNFGNGAIFFERPKMTLVIHNSFGFPVRMIFNTIDAMTLGGEVIPLGNAQLNEGVDFNYPSLSEVGESKLTTFVIDQNNSELENIIGQPVIGIDYEVLAIANPDSDTSIIGFLTDSSAFSLDVEVELPLYGRANNFLVRDTFKLDLTDFDNVRFVEFKSIAENGFPLEIESQIYFLDQNDVVLDSLFVPVESILEAAPVDGNGRVTEPLTKVTKALVEEERFSLLRERGAKLALRASLITTDDGSTSVKIYDDYQLNFKLGVIAGLTIDGE